MASTLLGEDHPSDSILLWEQHQSCLGVSPLELITRHVENARCQLVEARERLKASRRRVVQLEEVVVSWERLMNEMRASS
jgi:hypothetical protein